MTLWQRLLRWLGFGGPPTPVPVPTGHPALGVVCHLFDEIEATMLNAIGAKAVRLSWYGDTGIGGAYPGSNAWLDHQLTVAAAHGLSVVIVTQAPITPEYVALVGKRARTQLGNEPPNPVVYAATFRAAVRQYAGVLDLIPAGWASSDALPPSYLLCTPATLRAAIAAGLGDTGIICLHAYDPAGLAAAVQDRLAIAKAAGWMGRIAFTEVGSHIAGALTSALSVVPTADEAFVYALYSPATSFCPAFTLTPAQIAELTTFSRRDSP